MGLLTNEATQGVLQGNLLLHFVYFSFKTHMFHHRIFLTVAYTGLMSHIIWLFKFYSDQRFSFSVVII